MAQKSWEYGLAGLFKERENPQRIGAVIGKVESTDPAKISIRNGQFIIDADRLFVCNQLLERETTFKDFKANASQSGDLSVKCEHGGGKYSADGDITASGTLHLDEVWKVGDKVLVIPDESQQNFFVIDILRQPKGANPSLA